MANVTTILPLVRRIPTPLSSVYVRYEGDGWHSGVLSADGSLIYFGPEAYTFDPKEDEYVDATVLTETFLRQHPASILVRIAESDTVYLVSDPNMSITALLTMLNALLYRSGKPQLPPVDDEHANYFLDAAAKMCSNGVLELMTY